MGEKNNSFVVKSLKWEFIIMATCAFVFLIFIVFGIFAGVGIIEDDSVGLEYYLVFSSFLLFSLAVCLFYLPLKIIISGEKITVNKFLRTRREYAIKDITRLKLGVENLLVFVGDKIIFRVPYTSTGFSQLREMFERNKTPLFNYKNVRIEYDEVLFEIEEDE
ncbi:MAG: hypothetical protein LBL82_05165 [Oscillospiraceae bacterium]|jgi:hypothetical protein|nr:hypothetical protein [Oscillospiraceae bacterium]